MPAHRRRGRKEVEQVPEIEQQEQVSLNRQPVSALRPDG
jgi:hypothetical protein